jgi:hypothetical protein
LDCLTLDRLGVDLPEGELKTLAIRQPGDLPQQKSLDGSTTVCGRGRAIREFFCGRSLVPRYRSVVTLFEDCELYRVVGPAVADI